MHLSFLYLVTFAAALAVAAPQPLEARDTTWTCKNKKGNFKISQNSAEANDHAAPLSDGKTGSSYPHWFTNGYNGEGKKVHNDQIKFVNAECNKPPHHSKNGDGKDDHYLLEFPTFPNGHTYDYNKKKPKEDPGPARVIYTYPHKVFCGIVAHTDGNSGELKLCDK